MGPNGANQGQTGPNRAKLVQTGSDVVKQHQRRPNEIGPKCCKIENMKSQLPICFVFITRQTKYKINVSPTKPNILSYIILKIVKSTPVMDTNLISKSKVSVMIFFYTF